MSRRIVEEMYNRSRTRCVRVFVRDDGSFGFCEEEYFEESYGAGWAPVREHSASFCDSLATVMREVHGRVSWLRDTTGDWDGEVQRRLPPGSGNAS